MEMLLSGLLLLLGSHSVRLFADGWRARMLARLGPNGWKALYSLVSLAGLVLVVTGYAAARQTSPLLYASPVWTGPAATLLMLPALAVAAAAFVPGTRIKAAIGHPLVAATKLWAAGHLLANGRLVDVVLFGAILLWAGFDFSSLRRRDRASGTRYPAGPLWRDGVAVALGAALWVVMLGSAHGWLTGVDLLAK